MAIAKEDVINLTGGITTDDGRQLFGMDAEHYQKMKKKEDPTFYLQVGRWIEKVLDNPLDDVTDLWGSLKSGVVLCELANKIKPNIIKKFNKGTNLHPLRERENIQLYLEACWKLSVDHHCMFVTSDLHTKREMKPVATNIAALSRVAHSLGLCNVTIGPQQRPPSTSKWEVPVIGKPIYSGQLEGQDPIELELNITKQELVEEKKNVEKYKYLSECLQEDVKKLKEELQLTNRKTDRNVLLLSRELEAMVNMSKSESYDTVVQALTGEKEQIIEQYERELASIREERDKALKQLEDEREKRKSLSYKFSLLKREESKTKRESLGLLRRTKPAKSMTSSNGSSNPRSLRMSSNRRLQRNRSFLNTTMIPDMSLAALEGITTDILNSIVVTSTRIDNVRGLLKTDAGRRCLAFLLREHFKTVASVKLSNTSFESMLVIYKLSLDEIHISNGYKQYIITGNSKEKQLQSFFKVFSLPVPLTSLTFLSADYISAKLLRELSFRIYRQKRNTSEYLKERIKGHFIFMHLGFWEEYFCDDLAKAYSKAFVQYAKQTKASTDEHNVFLARQLEKFVLQMFGWGKIPVATLHHFVSQMADKFDLPDDYVSQIEDAINHEAKSD